MLPAAYATPAAAVLALGGLLACFAGFRLFRIVLALYGCLIGAAAMIANVESPGLWMLILAAVVGGAVGAVLAIVAYFMVVGLVGAGLVAFLFAVVWRFIGGDPPTVLLVVGCVLGALAALSIVRYVVVFGTALAGAWTFLVGVLALSGDPQAMAAASAGDVLAALPIHGPAERWWLTAGWAVLALAGAVVQLRMSKGKGRGKGEKK
jgi:hypothetical protein